MKRQISLLLALVMLLATVVVFPAVSVNAAEAAATPVGMVEGFENAETLFEDTALWSDATTQIVTENKISGNKSLYVEATSDWVNILGTSVEEFNLAPNTFYRFTVSYRMANTSDSNIQVVLNDGRYGRFNAPGGYMWEGSDIANDNHTTFRTNGDVKTLSMVFTTSSEEMNWLKLQICWANADMPLQIYFDDFKIEPVVAEEITENFEDATSIDDSIIMSNASGKEIVGDSAIAGNKSLYVESTSDWQNILGVSVEEFALEPNTEYRFSVTYRMANTNDINIQVVLSDNRYARFNASGANMWEGNSELIDAEHTTFTTEGEATKLSILFTTNSDASGWLKLQVCWANADAPLQMYFDDFKIEPVNGGEALVEDFEDAASLFEDTALWSDATIKIIESNKALHITNTKEDWLRLAATDLSKVALVPDTDYVFSFSFTTPDVAVGNEAYNCCQMQVVLPGSQSIRFTAYNPNYVEGSGSIASGYSFKRDSNGVVTIVLRFRTAADGSDTYLRIEGGIWQTADVFGDLDITFDNFHIAPASDSFMENFSTKDIIEETNYTSSAANVTIENNELFGGNALHIKNNEINAWTLLTGSNTNLVQLEADTTYQFSFKYYIAESDDLDSIQLEIKNADNGVTRCVRFNATSFGYDVNTTDATLGANMHFEKDETTGIVTVALVFTTPADGSEVGVSLVGDCWGVGIIDAWFDDISICKSNVKYNGMQDKYAIVTASDLENVSEIGYEVNGSIAATTDYVNPMVVDNSYFIANDSGVYYGDINVDGTFDALDLAQLRKWILTDTGINYAYEDVNGDYELDIRDLVRCKKALASVAYEFNTDDFGIDFVYPFLAEATEGAVCPFAVVNGLKVYGLSSAI